MDLYRSLSDMIHDAAVMTELGRGNGEYRRNTEGTQRIQRIQRGYERWGEVINRDRERDR